jgi:Ketopantoate reductase PanE/ApbA
MGKRIAVIGVGAVGGYTGAHMVRAGEDVTFIDMWPAHVDEMKRNGLRITHHEGEAPFSVKVRALHLTEAQHLLRGADRHRLCLHQILRHSLGGAADPPVSGAGRLCRLTAELYERRDDRRCRRLGQDDGLHRQQHQRRSC